MQRMVSDETWAQLDRDAGALTRGQRRRAYARVLLVVVLGGAGYGLWGAGFLHPHLDFDQGSYGWRKEPQERTFTAFLTLENRGLRTEHVRELGRSGRGLRLVDVQPLPADLAPHSDLRVELTYQVTDCGDVQQGRWPVPVTVDSRDPDQIVNLQPPDLDPMIDPVEDLDTGDLDTSTLDAGEVDAQPVTELPWQEALAAMACVPADQA